VFEGSFDGEVAVGGERGGASRELTVATTWGVG
jgi:hypothetical protein